MSYFKDTDFKRMRWPVYKAKSIDETKTDDITEFRRLKSKKLEVIKYFCLLYDKGSPLPRRLQDTKERKLVAAKLAGFDTTRPDDHNYVMQLSKLSLPVHVDIVKQMLRLQHNRDFSRISALEYYFEECVDKMLSLVEESDKVDPKKMLDAMTVKDTMRKSMKATSEELDSLYAKIYGDDNDLEEIVNTMTSWTPESVADLSIDDNLYDDDEW